MSLLVFIDESGNNNLASVDSNFPVFVLCAVAMTDTQYHQTVRPVFEEFKSVSCGSPNIILRSSNIKRKKNGFEFLRKPGEMDKFCTALDDVMSKSPHHILASTIDVVKHREKYITPHDPYYLGIEFMLPKIVMLAGENSETDINIIFEQRGAAYDKNVRKKFEEYLQLGTRFKSAERFAHLKFHIWFEPKGKNLIGNQIADLSGYAIGRHYLSPPYRSYPIVEEKIYRGAAWLSRYNRATDLYGLKIFP